MYLLDTNILLELLLNQKKADEVERLLLETPPEMLSVSEFTIDSIGVILIRRIMHDIFLKAVEDMLLVEVFGIIYAEIFLASRLNSI